MNACHSGLYVHVPFCKTKCPYCDFCSVVDLRRRSMWAGCVQLEAAHHMEEFHLFDTLYLGGGTPSVLDLHTIQELIDGLRSRITLMDKPEITMEMNPDDVNEAILPGIRNAGVNRISLGVQSFDDSILQFLGRQHSTKQNLQALKRLRKAGFHDVNIDLIYGIHGQSEADWLSTLKKTLAFRPAHISCYLLSIEDSTPFGTRLSRGRLQKLDEETERNLYLLTSQFLRDQGYEHYEVSSFARSVRHRSRHNQKYWHHTPYLGIGPGAHSFQAGKRWWNIRSVGGYIESFREGTTPLAGSEKLTDEQLRLETLYMGFRMSDGLALCFVQTFPHWETTLDDLIRDRLVRVTEDRVIPTPEAYVVSDGLIRMFHLNS